MKTLLAMTWLALVSASLAIAAPGTTMLRVRPLVARPGGTITISASSTPCLKGDQVFLISKAFPGKAFGGEGALSGRVRSHGAFSVRGHLRKTLRPGRYQASVRCGGGVLPVSAHFHVR